MGSRNSPFAGRGRATMLMVETSPARLGNVKASLKRSIDRDSLLVQEAGKVKKPKYAGTIYEAMLAPLAPATTLTTPRPRPPPQPKGDPGLQADLADLVKLGKKDKMESWLGCSSGSGRTHACQAGMGGARCTWPPSLATPTSSSSSFPAVPRC